VKAAGSRGPWDRGSGTGSRSSRRPRMSEICAVNVVHDQLAIAADEVDAPRPAAGGPGVVHGRDDRTRLKPEQRGEDVIHVLLEDALAQACRDDLRAGQIPQ